MKNQEFKLAKDKVKIHTHIHHPGQWVMTCRELGITGKPICPMEKSKQEVRDIVLEFLCEGRSKWQNVVNEI